MDSGTTANTSGSEHSAHMAASTTHGTDAAAQIARIREELPATTATVYLNTGTCGPLPRRTIAAMRQAQEEELAHGRIAPDHYPHLFATLNMVKAAIARTIGCDPTELALTRHTTDGMNLAIAGYPWQVGDEIVTSNIEHPSGLGPMFMVRRRWGVEVRVADIGIGGGETAAIVAAFEREMTPRTRMLVVSHIPYTTGAVLPLKEITAMAHAHGVLVLVDGAQSYGQIPLDMHDLEVDYYAMPGQKWMCGPEGTGAFYARAASLEQIEQTIVGPFGMVFGSLAYATQSYDLAPGSQRFDVGSVNMPLLMGQLTSTTWINDELGMPWVTTRAAELGATAARLLAAMPGVEVFTPAERRAGLVTFAVAGIDPEVLMQRLFAEHNISLRFVTQYINNPRANRLATGFYNNEEDLQRLVKAIEAVQRTL